eukprot:5690225-Prymnesium_polylepis.1
MLVRALHVVSCTPGVVSKGCNLAVTLPQPTSHVKVLTVRLVVSLCACLSVGHRTIPDACHKAATARDDSRSERISCISLKSCTTSIVSTTLSANDMYPLAGSVDNLEDISNLDMYIARTDKVGARLLYRRLFCIGELHGMIHVELRACVKMGKRIIPVVDPDASKGGLTQDQVHEQLIKAENELYQKWRFEDIGLSAEDLYTALFTQEPIEWNRIGVFQDV